MRQTKHNFHFATECKIQYRCSRRSCKLQFRDLALTLHISERSSRLLATVASTTTNTASFKRNLKHHTVLASVLSLIYVFF